MLEAYTLDDFTRKTIEQYEKVLSSSKTRKAARRYRERAKLAEKELAYQRLKGRALALLDRDPKKAAEEASRLLDFRSDDPTLHCIKGTAAVLLFDYETGESRLKESIDLFPCADIKPYFYLAALLRQRGRHPEAVDVLLAAQRVFFSLPDDATALLQQHLRSSYAALEGAGTQDPNGLLATGT
jgi:tetratricopeptide (TPR) repeat protein